MAGHRHATRCRIYDQLVGANPPASNTVAQSSWSASAGVKSFLHRVLTEAGAWSLLRVRASSVPDSNSVGIGREVQVDLRGVPEGMIRSSLNPAWPGG
jgi:hypothetical protein